MEFVSDILFSLYDLKNYDPGYECLIKGLFLDAKRTNLLDIDSKNFDDNKNKSKTYFFYNQNFLKDIADGEDLQDIIFSVYFILYIVEKKVEYENVKKNKKKDKFSFLLEILELLLKNCRKLIKNYNKKIKNSIKEFTKKNNYKQYINFLEVIIKKNNSKNISTNEIIDYYKKTSLNDVKNFDIKQYRKNSLLKQSFFVVVKAGPKIRINKNYIDEINTQARKKNLNQLSIKIHFRERANSCPNLSFKENFLVENYESKIDIDKKDDDNFLENNEQKVDTNNNLKLIKMQRASINKQLNRISIKSDDKIVNNIKTKEDEKYLMGKLKKINLPSLYYKKIFRLSEANILKRLFNPKEYYFWNKFTLILKDIIFSPKKFAYLHKLFKLKNRKHNIKYSSNIKGNIFSLKYPTKLKNFVCDDYYRPFLKPDLNFFSDKLLINSHNYLNEKFINESTDFNNYKISKINFARIMPFNYDELNATSKIVCECVNDQGSIFGNLYINHAFLLFVSSQDEDKRNPKHQNNYENISEEEFYLYSFFLEERRNNKNKYIIMYYSEIKEIVIRRFCYNYIGYEFFMKNNKSYLFNFFNKDNLKYFIHIILKKLENLKKEYKKNNNSENNTIIKIGTDKISSITIFIMEKDEEINFNIINDLVQYFNECNFHAKYLKGELSNFKYLLLLNKYSSRSYNNLFEYLVFPLLYFDIPRTIERDLSKAIALYKNKSNYENTLMNIQLNYENFGCHFNYHYSTSGYILYYLVRINPFTNIHLKFQSNKFDVPKRIFYTLDNYFKAIIYSEENRELIPEFFHHFEMFLNLNYLNLGYLHDENVIISDFLTDDNNGIIEFVINLRQLLEKRDIIPWVNNIFGYNVYNENNNNNCEIYNRFPASSYQENNDYESLKIKLKEEGETKSQIINDIKNRLTLLSLGICPIQLFKHPLRTRKNFNYLNVRKGFVHWNINKKSSVENNFNKDINKFLKQFKQGKSKMFLIDDNHEQKLVIKTKKIIQIFKLFNNDSKHNIQQKELWTKKFIKIHPHSKMFCELYPEILLICRYIDATIQIHYSSKYTFQIRFDNIITSVEYFSHEEKKDSTNITIHINKIILGDELGYISLVHIEYELNNKKQMNLKRARIEKNIKAHNSAVQSILYEKRLNIIISYSIEGQIMINNAFDFNVINIIDIGNEFYIKDIKISKYDLIYIYCTDKENETFNYIKCYSLNGIKYTEMKTEKKIINYFVFETLLIIYEDNIIESFNLYNLQGNSLYKNEINKHKQDLDKKGDKNKNVLKNNESNKIIMCSLNNLDKKLVIIYDDFCTKIEEVLYMLLKE